MKRVLLIIISFIAISCNRSNVNINKEIIEELAKGDFEIPSVNGFLLLFISTDKGEIGCTNVDVLHEVFLRYYTESYKSFETFLSDALNQKIIFSQQELGSGTAFFSLSYVVAQRYTKSELPDFINLYFQKIADGEYSVKKKYINEYLYSILYYCFINNYQVALDDFEGKYFIQIWRGKEG